MAWKTPTAFALVVVASTGAAALAGQEAGQAGAKAGRAEIIKQAEDGLEEQRNAQVAGCKRGNLLRQESNERIPAHETQAEVLRKFLATAEKARMAAYRRDKNPEDLMAARQYREGQKLMRTVRFQPIKLVDCERAYPPVRR